MIGWRDPSSRVAPRVTTCDNSGMNPLDQARAVIAGADAKRVATDANGRTIVHPVSTHLLARRAVRGWFDLGFGL